MRLPKPNTAALAVLSVLATCPYAASAINAKDIPEDTPINQLVSSAKAQLAAGQSNDALVYFDVAISRDPNNYLTIFQRGATQLSLGRAAKARADFDRVLFIKPDFEGALIQRAKLKGRDADWAGAKKDYETAGKQDSPELKELLEAETAVGLAYDAQKNGDYEQCIHQAGIAIMVAGSDLGLRQLRSGCRFERGEILEGVSDLQHILQLKKEDLRPHMQISANLFYSAGDMQKGVEQIAKCLQSDPDSKACAKLRKQEKRLEKTYKQMKKLEEKNKFSAAAKLLVGEGEEQGLLGDVKEQMDGLREDGTIHKNAPSGLYAHLIERTCHFFVESGNKARAKQYCAEALTFDANCLPALVSKAQQQIDADEFEPAIATLNQAKEHHGQTHKIGELLQKAHTLLKRSKQKDYYKVLGVSRDADERTIKKTYRGLVKQNHPDKAAALGVPREEAEKKIVALNEAYEVLSDPEKKQMFDNGQDPNDPQGGSPFQGSPFGHGAGGQPIFFQGGGPFGGGGGGGGGGFQFKQGGFQFNF